MVLKGYLLRYVGGNVDAWLAQENAFPNLGIFPISVINGTVHFFLQMLVCFWVVVFLKNIFMHCKNAVYYVKMYIFPIP